MENPVRKLRLQLKQSIGEFSKTLNVNPGTVGKMEVGKSRLPTKAVNPMIRSGLDPFKVMVELEEFIQSKKKKYHKD